MSIRVVHFKKSKYDIYIGRPSKWGNPFTIGEDGTREEVIKKYRDWITTQPDLLLALPELKDKILGCWCAPKSCHGDVLVDLIRNNRREEMSEQFAKWVLGKLAEVPGALPHNERGEMDAVDGAHFWLSAFVREINRREDECDNSGLGCPYESRSQCRGDKLRSLVREFGLDGEK